MSKVDTLKLELGKYYSENGSFDGFRVSNPKLYDQIRTFMKREIGFFPKFLLLCGYDVLYHGLPLDRSRDSIIQWLLETGRLEIDTDVSHLALFITRSSRVTFKLGDTPVLLGCEGCESILPAEEFNASHTTKIGKQSKCRSCEAYVFKKDDRKKNGNAQWRNSNLDRVAETGKRYYLNNINRIRESSKKWYIDNVDKVRENGKRHYLLNRDKILKRGKIRYAINREPKLQYCKSHYLNNKDMYRRRSEKRRVIMNELPYEKLNEDKLKSLQGNVCPLTLEPLNEIDCNLEHFIPISWGNFEEDDFMGGHVFGNCYYLEKNLNMSKWNKNPFEWIEEQSEFIRSNFYDILVPLLADRNGLSVEEFSNKVKLYWRNNKLTK
ncbi:hypothetical protein [Bacillus sp. AFS031507]|uniref:hypothetical protein n=1 Tax=Bacillus sp. AFS031507 TaxID=2033496 RepID=UPI000BFD9F37|nr:hypothetical protein [Bacillus sp. AFS031507]PGY07100.1 hypothetical protein COE25_25160 [Bacillus sp. AFS031507]